jgi:hypothetical protein
MSQTRGDNLETAINNLKSYAVADSTKALYSAGFELYVKFLQLQGQHWSQEQLPPVSEYLLMRFIAFSLRSKVHMLCKISNVIGNRTLLGKLECFFLRPINTILRLGKGLPKKFSKGLKPPFCR